MNRQGPHHVAVKYKMVSWFDFDEAVNLVSNSLALRMLTTSPKDQYIKKL
ncbi:hypothetical protein Hanom_Chr12g01131771 [Helianthus anomalus]